MMSQWACVCTRDLIQFEWLYSPVWDLIWVRRWLGWLKLFPQSWQKYCPCRMRDLSIPDHTKRNTTLNRVKTKQTQHQNRIGRSRQEVKPMEGTVSKWSCYIYLLWWTLIIIYSPPRILTFRMHQTVCTWQECVYLFILYIKREFTAQNTQRPTCPKIANALNSHKTFHFFF